MTTDILVWLQMFYFLFSVASHSPFFSSVASEHLDYEFFARNCLYHLCLAPSRKTLAFIVLFFGYYCYKPWSSSKEYFLACSVLWIFLLVSKHSYACLVTDQDWDLAKYQLQEKVPEWLLKRLKDMHDYFLQTHWGDKSLSYLVSLVLFTIQLRYKMEA